MRLQYAKMKSTKFQQNQIKGHLDRKQKLQTWHSKNSDAAGFSARKLKRNYFDHLGGFKNMKLHLLLKDKLKNVILKRKLIWRSDKWVMTERSETNQRMPRALVVWPTGGFVRPTWGFIWLNWSYFIIWKANLIWWFFKLDLMSYLNLQTNLNLKNAFNLCFKALIN